jgi:hypothetical protein
MLLYCVRLIKSTLTLNIKFCKLPLIPNFVQLFIDSPQLRFLTLKPMKIILNIKK